MNTRLQVEHPVTEAITGQDLVRWQLLVAMGHPLPLPQEALTCRGHAMEVRLYAEDPRNNYLPQTGKLGQVYLPHLPGVRFDSGIISRMDVTPDFDPMLAKLVASGATRDEARSRLIHALRQLQLTGVMTNRQWLAELLATPDVAAAHLHTGILDTPVTEDVPNDQAKLAMAALALLARTQPTRQTGSTHPGWPNPWDVIRDVKNHG
jgi:geranyl-CoA carboxylase alpha subunit